MLISLIITNSEHLKEIEKPSRALGDLDWNDPIISNKISWYMHDLASMWLIAGGLESWLVNVIKISWIIKSCFYVSWPRQ